MKKRAHPSHNPRLVALGRQPEPTEPRTSIAVKHLSVIMTEWLDDCRIKKLSPNTINCRQGYCDRLIWYLTKTQATHCGREEMRAFFMYMSEAHVDEKGRWGAADSCRLVLKPVEPSTVQTYYKHLRTFFRFAVDEEYMDSSPMEKISATGRPRPLVPVPVNRNDQICPFTWEQATKLREMASLTNNPRRDHAIVSLLLDSGMRASELCSLTLGNLDLMAQSAWVMGKLRKRRKIKFGRKTKKAIAHYIRWERYADNSPTMPLFLSDRGEGAGNGLTRSGLLQIFVRIREATHFAGVRVSPHTCRHFFAVSFLRAGGNAPMLQELMGHTDIKQTMIYVNFVEADIDASGSEFSPLDRLDEVQKKRLVRQFSLVDLLDVAK